MLRSNLEVHCYASNKIIIHTLAFSYLSFAILDSSSAATKMFFNNKYCRQYIVYLKSKMFSLPIEYIKSKEKKCFSIINTADSILSI